LMIFGVTFQLQLPQYCFITLYNDFK
jgi:hypothetical protein